MNFFITIFSSLFNLIWTVIKIPLLIAVIIIAIMVLIVFLNYLYLNKIKKIPKQEQGERYKVEQDGFLKKLFVLAPRQIALDRLKKNPEDFEEMGLRIYVGPQGAGKSIAMIRDTRLLQLEYPKAKCISNMGYIHADKTLKDWKQMLDYKNDKKGVIIQMDEIQAWFSSNNSKNMPDDLIAQISQNRKQRRLWLGTAQVFTRVAKPIREQTMEVRKCMTLFKCITIVHRTEPQIDEEGKVVKYRSLGWYWFVQNEELRNMYDTYEVIESNKKVGALPRSERMADDNNNFNVIVDNKNKKK